MNITKKILTDHLSDKSLILNRDETICMHIHAVPLNYTLRMRLQYNNKTIQQLLAVHIDMGLNWKKHFYNSKN